MNRIQFWIVTGLSGLVFVLLIAHIFLSRQVNIYSNTMSQAQMAVNQGQASKTIAEQLADLIGKNSSKSQALKDLMGRQQITMPESTNAPDNSATPPAATPTH